MGRINRITPFLWFDANAEDAANFYTAVFDNSRILRTVRYGEAGTEVHGGTPGSVMTVEFELDGVVFTGINGGPHFHFTEAVSFVVHCASQTEVDSYWERLGAGGDPKAQQCGWLKDKFGLSWQIVPDAVVDMIASSDYEKSQRAMRALLQMKKIDIAAVERAYNGG